MRRWKKMQPEAILLPWERMTQGYQTCFGVSNRRLGQKGVEPDLLRSIGASPKKLSSKK
jgi:hypothetical protein